MSRTQAGGEVQEMGMVHRKSYHDGDLDVLQHIADARMYEDKALYYERTGLRR